MSAGQATPILETRDLLLHFGGVVATDHVSFGLPEGQVRALIGPNGAGKTSFFNLLTGVLRPQGGRIFFKGRDITHMPPYRRVKLGIGRSFQVVNLFPELTVKENVQIAVQASLKQKNHLFERVERQEISRRTDEILSQYEWIRDPDQEAGALIYPEQKKLETILALALEPELVLLDEPTAGVDENDIGLITDMINTLSQNRTILLTDHDIKFVMKIAQRITVMDQGRIISEGTPSEVASDPRVDECYFGGLVECQTTYSS
ncbi:MAG: ABC transporter ATP-binding protein [Desulfarculus sp.]|jgi:branched-chain amino acid transport system ATP-binding protein|nr:MAG: ABC transporter ATP-binding protein [Desulfarculus sp.]